MKLKMLLILFCLTSCGPPYDMLIQNVNVIDLQTGTMAKHNIFIKDSLIVKIGDPNLNGTSSAKHLIDGTDHFLIPSFWDMHVHIQDSTYFSMFLDYGVTGVRDMGGCANQPTDGCESLCPDQLNQWKQAINAGVISGPQLFVAGPTLSGTGWPTSLPVNTKDEVALAFETNLNNEVDFFKVYEQIPKSSYQEIARLADLYNIDFVGHISETMLVSDISNLGQKSIEHIREPILFCFTNDPDELEAFMQADGYTEADREFVRPWVEDANNVIESFKRNGTWFTPTIAVQFARQRYEDTTWIDHPLRNSMPSSVREGLFQHLRKMRENEDQKGDSLWWMAHKKLVKRFHQEGIGLLAGSDAACEGGLPGYTLHEELFFMVEQAGLTPLAALQTATVNPCLYFDLPKRGKISETYYADLLLLSKNPLENIRNSLSIKAVIKNGAIERIKKEM